MTRNKNNRMSRTKVETFKEISLSALFLLFFLFFINLTSSLPDDAGNNIDFTYETQINYSTINTNHSHTTDCWLTAEGIKCDVSDITYDEISGGDVEASGYTGHFSYINGTTGAIDINGDPWYLSGTDLEIANNLTVDGNSYLSDTYPRTTLTYSLGSGALRWLKLWVQDINAENIDAYNMTLSNNLTVGGTANFTGDMIVNGINISNLSNEFVPYINANKNVNITPYNLTTGGLTIQDNSNDWFKISKKTLGGALTTWMLSGQTSGVTYPLFSIERGLIIAQKSGETNYGLTMVDEDNVTKTFSIVPDFDSQTALISGSVVELTIHDMSLESNENISTTSFLKGNTILQNNVKVCDPINGLCNQTVPTTTDDLTEGSVNLYDNKSWNETRADTLYAGINEPLWSANLTAHNSTWSLTYNATYNTWAYNQTIPANTYSDELNTSQTNWVDTFFVKITDLVGLVGNWSADKTNYYIKTDVDTNISSAVTSLSNITIARVGNCPAGQVVMNTTTDGVQCIAVTSGTGFVTDQDNNNLNKTANVTYNNINMNGELTRNAKTIIYQDTSGGLHYRAQI